LRFAGIFWAWEGGFHLSSTHLPPARSHNGRTGLPAFPLQFLLYTPENLGALLAQVRDELQDRVRQLREVERALENIKQAIHQGILTPTTKAMLEDAERRYKAL
jgi:hypothetical protein